MKIKAEIAKANVVNINGRLYTKEALINAVNNYNSKDSLCYLYAKPYKETPGWDRGVDRKMEDIIGVCEDLKFDNNNNTIVAEFRLIDSNKGKEYQELIRSGLRQRIVANYITEGCDGSGKGYSVVRNCKIIHFDLTPESSWTKYLDDFSMID